MTNNEESVAIETQAELVDENATLTTQNDSVNCSEEQKPAPAEPEKVDDDYLLKVIDLKEWFPIKTSLIKSRNVYLKAVDGISFNLKQGKTIGIVGESGCGKTTLGRTILRLYQPTAGQIIFNGKHIEKLKGEALRKMRPHFQMIFQDPYSSLSPRLTVGEIVGEAVRTHGIVPKSEYKDYIIDIMTKCGLQPHYFDRYPHEFSGGQRQRICIAKALALKPQLVICDEPVSALDVSIQAQVINLFEDLQAAENLAYIFISHDLSVVEHISDQVGVMYLGNMVEFGDKKDLFSNPMHPYTQALFSAVPIPDPDTKIKRIILQGDIPSPAHPPKGCKFHTRCSKCMDICREVEPKFIDYGNGHCVACHLYSQDGPVAVDEDGVHIVTHAEEETVVPVAEPEETRVMDEQVAEEVTCEPEETEEQTVCEEVAETAEEAAPREQAEEASEEEVTAEQGSEETVSAEEEPVAETPEAEQEEESEEEPVEEAAEPVAVAAAAEEAVEEEAEGPATAEEQEEQLAEEAEEEPVEKEAAGSAAEPVEESEEPAESAGAAKAPAKKAKKKPAEPDKVLIEGDPDNPHGKFVIKKTSNGNFVYKLYSSNFRVLASPGGAYKTLSSCNVGVQSVIANAATAPIEDTTLIKYEEQKCPKWVIYEDKAGEFRLRLLASNGNVVAITNDGYTTKAAAKKGIEAIARAAKGASVVRNDTLW